MRLLLCILILLLLPAVGYSQPAGEQLIDKQELVQVLNDFLSAESEQLPRVELRFKKEPQPLPFKVPAGRIEYQVVPAKPGVIGSRRLTLMTRIDGQIVNNQSVRVELEAMAEVMVAAEQLQRGNTIGPNNISYQQQDISKLKQPLFDGEEIYGKRMKRTVRLGQPLLRKQIEFPPLIRRGERVTIQAQRGALTLTAAGEAKQDGLADEMIRVMNVGSRKVVLCRVAGPGQVVVEF